jgi:putative transposase
MGKRRSRDEILRLLKEADRDWATGLTVSDVCRKLHLNPTTYDRWRHQLDPATEEDRRVRELTGEVDRLKRLVAEVMLDNPMLRDVAQKKW